MFVVGAISIADIEAELRKSADILFFLLGMMVLTAVTERAGVYEHLAEWSARLARGSGTLLYANVFILGAIVTTLLSLDVMIIVVTPIVYSIAVRRRLEPMPFMFACTFVANTGSLLLPISNLTNLLVFNDLNLGFVDFVRTMWLPELAAVGANFLVFRWLFRRSIPKRLPVGIEDPLPVTDWWYAAAAIGLALTLAGLFISGIVGIALSFAALAGVGVMLIIGRLSGRVALGEVRKEVSWPLFAFVIGMVLLVAGAEQTFLEGVTLRTFSDPRIALLVAAGASAIGSNIVNNVPMTLLALPFIHSSVEESRRSLTYGTLVGVNIGPTLTTYGSLATMLWLTTVRKRGLQVSTLLYLRVGLVTMPIVLIATLLALLITV